MVTGDGDGVVGHAGALLLGEVADRLGLTAALGQRPAGLRQRRSAHDPGRVLRDVAVMLADGGDCLSDLAVLRDQPGLFGEVASPATAWRTLERVAADPFGVDGIRAARRAARARAWAAAGGPPTVDGLVTVDVDATHVLAHSDKDRAAGTYKGKFGFYPLLAYLDRGDGTGEPLGGVLRPGNAGSNTVIDHDDVLTLVLDQLPTVPDEVPVLVRSDSAGASHGFVGALRHEGALFSVGFPVDERIRQAVTRVHVLPHLGKVELRNLRPSTVQAWVRSRHTEVAPSYCRLLLANLSTILAAAVDDGLLAANPCASGSVKAPKVVGATVVPWTVERVRRVVDAHPDEYRAAAAVGACCGLRQGEVFGLTVDAVDFLRRTVRVTKQVRLVGGRLVFSPPKGGRDRTVPLPDVAAAELAAHVQRRPPVEVTLPWVGPDGPPRAGRLLFVNRDGGALSRAYYLHNAWKPALKASQVERDRRNGFHALRHHYASVLLERGVSIRAVAAYLGHHDPGFTLRTYAHLMPDDEDRSRQAIDAAYAEAPADSVRTSADA